MRATALQLVRTQSCVLAYFHGILTGGCVMISKVRNRLDVLWALSRDVSGITGIPRWKVALDVVESRLLWGASEDDYRFSGFTYWIDRPKVPT